jgi:hypothetical protein
MNLILEEQANKVIFEDISKFDDYEDWIKCIVKDEEKRNESFFITTSMQISNVF